MTADDLDKAIADAIKAIDPSDRAALIERAKAIVASGIYNPAPVPYVPWEQPAFADVEAMNKAHKSKMKRVFG